MTELSKEFNDNFFKHIAELYIDPEIKRRRDASLLPSNFVLYAVQVIMSHDAPNEVRLNDEVSAHVVGNFAKPVTDGEQVSIDDLESIIDVQLTDRGSERWPRNVASSQRKMGWAHLTFVITPLERAATWRQRANSWTLLKTLFKKDTSDL